MEGPHTTVSVWLAQSARVVLACPDALSRVKRASRSFVGRGNGGAGRGCTSLGDSHKIEGDYETYDYFDPGDGIGPEVSAAVKQIIEAADVSVNWDEIPNRKVFEANGTDFVKDGVMPSVIRNRVALKGPMETAVATGAPSLNVALRQALELYANVRPVKNLGGRAGAILRRGHVLVRENTEDLYAGLEHTVMPGVVESLKIITEKASTRIAKFAFEYARAHGRKKIHAIHKANIMKLSDGLFLTSVRAVAKNYPDIEYKELIIDNACMQMVLNPHQFDMLVMTNLYGDIMSDLAAGLVGGLGVVPSGNIGENRGDF